jgi:hypothetical protein
MNSRLGIACLGACALTALIVASSGCSKGYNSGVTPPAPSPSPSGSPAPDIIYVQTSASKVIRQYKGASKDNGLVIASEVLPTGDITNGDVVYDPITDTLWYAEANQSNRNFIELWNTASNSNGKNPTLISFPFGEGTASFDPTHHLLFVATTTGPQVSVFANPETMTTGAVPGAVITLQINDGPSARPQEMLYDPGTDRLFVSDQVTMVSVFDGFGSAALNAVQTMTNPTIAPNRYIQGLFSPDGLAYAPLPTDVLFVGEQASIGDVVAVPNASTFNGPIGHVTKVSGFNRPGGMAFDNLRGLLYVYDTTPVYVITNAITASGTISQLVNNGTARSIFDGTALGNDGFGLALNTTPLPTPTPSMAPSPSPSPSAAIRPHFIH